MHNNKKSNLILYFFFFLFFLSATYFSIPKLLNFSINSIKENLKNNNNINIKNNFKLNYKIFPTPRLSIETNDFTIGKEILKISNSELEIILNINQILNFKKTNYKKLIIKKGTSRINLKNINQLLNVIEKNKKKLIFKENNLTIFKKDKVFLKIDNVSIKVSPIKEKKELILSGNFLNNKIFIKLDSKSKNKNNLTLKIPKLDIATRIFFEKNSYDNINGFFNLEVFNNFLKFNFIKEDNIKLTKGFVRSKLVNTSFDGEIAIIPNFFSILNFELSVFNIEKLFPVIQKTLFSDKAKNLPLIKKINGTFNFKSKIEGSVTNKNGEILFKNFKVGKNKSLVFNAKIIEFGKKGKIHFNLFKTLNYKKNLLKKIEIKGSVIPATSKVVFVNFLLDGKELSGKRIKGYEKKFEDEIIQNSLVNIFNISKIDKYLKNLF